MTLFKAMYNREGDGDTEQFALSSEQMFSAWIREKAGL